MAICKDTGPGHYECTCTEGFSGDGKTCQGNVIRIAGNVVDGLPVKKYTYMPSASMALKTFFI